MLAFIGWFVHYLVIFIVLVAVAVIGIFVGKKWSEHGAAKKAAAVAADGGESDVPKK